MAVLVPPCRGVTLRSEDPRVSMKNETRDTGMYHGDRFLYQYTTYGTRPSGPR